VDDTVPIILPTAATTNSRPILFYLSAARIQPSRYSRILNRPPFPGLVKCGYRSEKEEIWVITVHIPYFWKSAQLWLS
jgi:hypothetical protein